MGKSRRRGPWTGDYLIQTRLFNLQLTISTRGLSAGIHCAPGHVLNRPKTFSPSSRAIRKNNLAQRAHLSPSLTSKNNYRRGPTRANDMDTVPIVLSVLILIIFLIGLASLINITTRRPGPGGTGTVWKFSLVWHEPVQYLSKTLSPWSVLTHSSTTFFASWKSAMLSKMDHGRFNTLPHVRYLWAIASNLRILSRVSFRLEVS
jgi:hypothetical protein